jgi:hypothetical protein
VSVCVCVCVCGGGGGGGGGRGELSVVLLRTRAGAVECKHTSDSVMLSGSQSVFGFTQDPRTTLEAQSSSTQGHTVRADGWLGRMGSLAPPRALCLVCLPPLPGQWHSVLT